MAHTPTPWEAQDFDEQEDGVAIIGLRTNDGVPYHSPTNGMVAWATMHPTEAEAKDAARAKANAAFIIKACNAHESLIAEAKALRVALEKLDALIDFSEDNVENVWTFEDTSEIELAFELARDALALTSADRATVGGEK